MSLERTERREPSIATPSATGHTPSPGRPHLTPAIQWDPPRAVQRHREVDKTIVDVVIVLVIAWKNHGLRRASRFELVELVELVWSSRVASPRELNGSRELPRAEAAANGRPGKVAVRAQQLSCIPLASPNCYQMLRWAIEGDGEAGTAGSCPQEA
jgi:hypothetical protein